MSGEGFLELTIDSLAAGGDGVGRADDGRVVFVPESAPGDRVRVSVVERHSRFARARLETVLEAGPDRCEARCPVFGRCGGCSWQHVTYPAQVEAKRAILEAALARIGGRKPSAQTDFVASPDPYGYRNRARVLVANGRVGFRERRSQALCPVTGCPLLTPALDRALGSLAASPPAGSGEWELAEGAGGAVRVACLAGGVQDAKTLEVEVGAARLRVSAGVFMQSNAALFERLARDVVEAAGSGEQLLELYAGAGFFTLGLAARFGAGLAVEGDRRASRDLSHNLERAGVLHVRALCAGVAPQALARWLKTGSPDVVVLDPPRAGLGRAAADVLAASAARRVVYLSCDPATLARDLARFDPVRWTLARVRGFDLFPQTPHVEALAVLEAGATS